MTLLRSLAMAFSCFSRIPVPHVEWRPESMRYMMVFFPFVGVAVSVLLALWLLLAGLLGFGDVLCAAGCTLVPLAVTGGIHMDGFADVVDAQASHAEPARKREILKDPHCGAFAVIATAAYLLAYFALVTELDFGDVLPVYLCIPFFVRCLSGVATIAFPKSTDEGMLAAFGGNADKTRSLACLLVLACAAAAFMTGANVPAGAAVVFVGIASLGALHVFARSQFGGMSGDLAGFFLQVAELAMVAALVVACKVVGL